MESLNPSCTLCNNTSFTIFYELKPYSMVKCASCGLICVSPMPDENERNTINETIYSSDNYKNRYFKDKRFFKRWSKSKLKLIEKWKPEKGKLLDIGCSYGFFLETAKRRGWNVSGVELNPITGAQARKTLDSNIFIGSIENVHFEKSSFDVITLWDVIEHTQDPVKFLNQIKPYLKPDGLFCLQVPNIESYIAKLKGGKWGWLTPGDHIYFFSPETLKLALKAAGLNPVYFRTWEPTGYFIDSLIGFNENNSFLFEFYRNTIVRIFRKFLFIIFMPFQYALRKNGRGALIEIYVEQGNQ